MCLFLSLSAAKKSAGFDAVKFQEKIEKTDADDLVNFFCFGTIYFLIKFATKIQTYLYTVKD